MTHGSLAQDRAKKLIIMTACRAFVGGILPTAPELGAVFGVSGSSVQKTLHKLAACGLVTIRRVRVPGVRSPTSGNPSTTRPIVRLRLEHVGTDAEFAAVYRPVKLVRPGYPKNTAKGLDGRRRVLAVVRLAHEQKRFLPQYPAMGHAIGISASGAYYHVQALIRDGVIKVQKVDRDDAPPRLRVMAVAP